MSLTPPRIPRSTNFPTGYSGFIDLVFVFLAWKTVLIVQMEFREKVAVGIAMSMGTFAAVCAVFKCTHFPLLSNPDFTYELSPIIIWSAAEASATIMAACVPSLRVLARTARSNVQDKFSRRGRRGYTSYGSRTYTNKASVQASTGDASLASTRPELRSRLSFERWALGGGERGKETTVSSNVIHVDSVIRLDWHPVQQGTGFMGRAMSLDSTLKVGGLATN